MQIQGETFKVQAKDRGGDLENLGRTKRLPWSLFPAKSLGNIPRVAFEKSVYRDRKKFSREKRHFRFLRAKFAAETFYRPLNCYLKEYLIPFESCALKIGT